MDRHLGAEAVAARFACFRAQAIHVAEIRIDGVDRRNARRGRCGEREVARQPIGRGETARLIAVRLRAKLRGQILRAPGDAGEPRTCVAIRAAEEKRRGGFGGERENFDRAVRQPVQRLARGELGVEMSDRRAALRLRQEDRIRFARDHDIEIVIGQPRVERVHTHNELWPVRRSRMLSEVGKRGLARARFAILCNRVLQIEDQRVRAGLRAFRELPFAVSRDEQIGSYQRTILRPWFETRGKHRAPHHEGLSYFGRISMKAWRLHSATSLSFWLYVRM